MHIPISFPLTHISLASFCGTSANSAKPDHTPQNAASDQVLHGLLTEVSFLDLNDISKQSLYDLNWLPIKARVDFKIKTPVNIYFICGIRRLSK